MAQAPNSDDGGSFAKVAPYLTHPLVLVGFALFLLSSFYQALIFSGVIPKLDAAMASPIVAAVVDNLFWAAVLIIILGCVLAFKQKN